VPAICVVKEPLEANWRLPFSGQFLFPRLKSFATVTPAVEYVARQLQGIDEMLLQPNSRC